MKKAAFLAVIFFGVSASASADVDRSAPELDNSILEAIREFSRAGRNSLLSTIEGVDRTQQHQDGPQVPAQEKRKPCSVKLKLEESLLARLEEGRFREVIEEILLAACKGVGRCDVKADFDDVSGQTIAALGLTGHEGEMFRNTIQHTIEGHSGEHEASKEAIDIELAELKTSTLEELAESFSEPTATT